MAPVSSVSAVSNFTVNFEQQPLFSEANFVPGQSVTRWVEVTNNTSESKTIGVKAKNYTSCSQDCLADQLNLAISDGESNLYEDSLANFFAAGEKKLSDLGAGAAIKYYFTITFLSGAGNNYQDKQVGFDFDIGIFGQETIGGGGETGDGGGGVFFGGETSLIIFNENASQPTSSQADITWETNHPATSRVIYSSQYESHVLDLNNPPNYGYVHSTSEDSSNVVNHFVGISGLVPGVTYYYRCVSHGSFAISTEHSFTVPGIAGAETGSEQGAGGEQGGGTIIEPISGSQSVGGGETQPETIGGQQEQQSVAGPNPFIAALSTFFSGYWGWILIILIILLIIYAIYRYYQDRKK